MSKQKVTSNVWWMYSLRNFLITNKVKTYRGCLVTISNTLLYICSSFCCFWCWEYFIFIHRQWVLILLGVSVFIEVLIFVLILIFALIYAWWKRVLERFWSPNILTLYVELNLFLLNLYLLNLTYCYWDLFYFVSWEEWLPLTL